MAISYRHHWTLDPEVTFLNHGSYGACPDVIQKKQQALREEMEREPVRFMGHRHSLIDRAREAAADFVGARTSELAFVPNATAGVNAALRSQRWKVGDQVLVTDHEYNACRNTLDYVAKRWGAEVVVARIPYPLQSEEEVMTAMLDAVTSRTVFCLVDHLTSPTALRLPLERLIPALQEKGIRVLVDGAHAPGQIPLSLHKLGADYYTGNFHKWACTPKGVAIFVAREDRHEDLHPAVISHGLNADTTHRSRFHQEFDWTGTFDPTAWGVVPETLTFMEGLVEGGWPAIMKRNHDLALEARQDLCQQFGVSVPAPESMIGTMAAVPMPHDLAEDFWERDRNLYAELGNTWGIQIPVIPWMSGEQRHLILRFSVHLHNHREDYRKLAEAITSMRS